MAVIACPGPEALKQFLLGQSSASSIDQVATHIERCVPCQAVLRSLPAEDTLVDAVRAQETLPEGPEQDSVRRLVARVRSLLPAVSRHDASEQEVSKHDQTVGSHTPPVQSSKDDTIGIAPSKGDATEDEGFAPAEEPDEIGRLAGYRVLKVLGVGGMGKVFLAEDVHLRRKVAVKVMKPELARNSKAKERFLKEARLAAQIEHDHIVHIYQVGEDRGIPFLAMQLLNGLSLEEMLERKGALKIQQILRIGMQIAEGLEAAHDQELIHRDIKPANIWIETTGGGRVKILDFGLARSTVEDISLTQSGAILGTPAYMAPEQARGEQLDQRCDLYSLGCVLYRLATGELPIHGKDTMAMLMALALHDPKPPRQLRDDLPESFCELVMALLAKNRDNRPQNAREVITALKAIQRETADEATPAAKPVAAAPVQKKMHVARAPQKAQASNSKGDQTQPIPATLPVRRRKKSLVAIGVAFALVALLAAGVVFFIPTSSGVIRVESDDPKVSFKVDDKGNYVLVDADHKEITFEAGEHALKFKHNNMEFETDKFMLRKNDKVVVKVEFLKGKLAVLQNGTQISQKDIKTKVNPPTAVVAGTPIQLKKATWVPDKSTQALPGMIPHPALRQDIGRWQVIAAAVYEGVPAESPDGRWLAVWRRPYVLIYDAQSGALSAMGREKNVAPPHHLSWPSLEWSPDSKWIRTGYRGDPQSIVQVHFFAVDGTLSPLSAGVMGAESGWNPKYPVVACQAEGQPNISLYDPSKAKPVATQIAVGTTRWSPDGESLLVVRQDKTAQIFGRDGTPGAKLEGTVEMSPAPVWTADGSMIAALTGPETIRLWKKDGSGGPTCKHDNPVKGLWWYAAAKLIAASDEKNLRFWTLDGAAHASLDVPGVTSVSFAGDGVVVGQDYWSNVKQAPKKLVPNLILGPDGKFGTIHHQHVSLGMVEMKDGEAVELDWRIPLSGGRWFSRDGKRLFVHDLKGIAAYDVRDAKKVTHMGGGFGSGQLAHCVLSPKGDKLAVASTPGLVTVCDPLGQPLGKPVAVSDDPMKASTSFPHFSHLSWSPDGRHLVAITANIASILDVVDGKPVTSMNNHGWAAFAPDNPDHLVLTSSKELSLWRWKVERQPSLRIENASGMPVPSPDGKMLVLRAAPRGTPHIVSPDLKTRTPLAPDDLKGFNWGRAFYTPMFCWLPDGKHLLASTDPLTIRSGDGTLVETIKPVEGVSTNLVENLQLSPDGKFVVGWNGKLHLLNLADKKLTALPGIQTAPNHPGHFGFSPDSKYLIIPEESTLKYWNLATQELEQIVLLLPGGQHVIFSPAGEVLARSRDAEHYYRYVVEDKVDRLHVKTPAEFEKSAQ